MDFIHAFLEHLIEAAMLLFEYTGTVILIISGIKGVYNYIRKSGHVRLELAQGMAMGLEFKLGSEILKTVLISEMGELLIVGGIILLRAALTFLIHWEIQHESPQRED